MVSVRISDRGVYAAVRSSFPGEKAAGDISVYGRLPVHFCRDLSLTGGVPAHGQDGDADKSLPGVQSYPGVPGGGGVVHSLLQTSHTGKSGKAHRRPIRWVFI